MSRPRNGFAVQATLALAGATLCWAMVPLFLKHFTGYIDGWTANGLRYPLAMLIWLPWLLRLVRRGGGTRQFYLRALVSTTVKLVGQCLWAWAPYYIDPGLMAFVVRLNVVWATIAAIIIFADERRLAASGRFWMGLACGAVGFVGVSVYSGALQGGATTTGVLLMVACSLMWGLYAVTVRWAMRGVPAPEAFALIGGWTALGTLVLMFILGDPAAALAMPPRTVALLVISALVGIAAAHVLYYTAIARLGVAIVSGATLLSPFLTAAASAMIYGERLLPQQWACGVILVFGAGILVWAQRDLGTVGDEGKL